MQPADEYQLVRPGVAFWQAHDPAVKTDLCCCALETAGGFIFCDPIPLAPAALDELLAGGPPAAILLTSANHERAAVQFSKRFKIEIWAHAAARGELPATRWFEEGDPLPGNVGAISLPGFAAGETGYFIDGLLILGDAVINVAPYGFSILPDKYCDDPKLARESLQKLLPLSVETIVFAHGLPIVTGARERLGALVASP